MRTRFLQVLVILPLALAAPQHQRRSDTVKYIVPGARWLDTAGDFISAHAGAVIQHEGTFYWFGQDIQDNDDEFIGASCSVVPSYHVNNPLTASVPLQINLYTSPDLTNWTRIGHALSPVNGTGIASDRVVERPKVIYNEPTQQWVLWFHADNSSYGLLQQGIATSPNITGPYEFQSVFSPLSDFSQDFGLFQDDDGQAYALYSNGDSEAGRDNKIDRLNDEFIEEVENVYTFHDIDLEAPTILRTDSKYYIIMSHKTGYRPNNVVYYSADKLSGPWSISSYIAPPGTRTYNTQSGWNIRLKGSKQITYIYVGDHWDAYGLPDSRYIWLPLIPHDDTGKLELVWKDVWAIDVDTGEWWAPEGTSYEAESGTTIGNARVAVSPDSSGHKVVTGIAGANSNLTISGITGTGNPQWVSLHYINSDDMGFGDNPAGSPDRIGGKYALRRIATVSVNGGDPVELKQRSSNEGIVLTASIELTFQEGSDNYITIGGANNTNGKDWAADLDKIVVYE